MRGLVKQLKKWVPVLSILPFLLGAAGYAWAGERLLDALYYSFSLYFVNLVSDSSNLFVDGGAGDDGGGAVCPETGLDQTALGAGVPGPGQCGGVLRYGPADSIFG